MTRRLAPLACVLLVVTAGCAGIGTQNDQTTTAPTQSVGATAETPTETATTTESPEQLAPGVTADGVEDAFALADAHFAAIRDRPLVVHDRIRRTNESGTGIRNATLAMTNESHWRYSVTRDRIRVSVFDARVFETYADGERMLSRTENESTVQYDAYILEGNDGTVAVPPDQIFEQSYRGLYGRSIVYTLAGNTDRIKALDDSEGAARLFGNVSELTLGSRQVTDAEYTMTVAGDGQVQSVEMIYDDGNATVAKSLSFDTDVTDPVEQPGWYETALNETGLSEGAAKETDA